MKLTKTRMERSTFLSSQDSLEKSNQETWYMLLLLQQKLDLVELILQQSTCIFSKQDKRQEEAESLEMISMVLSWALKVSMMQTRQNHQEALQNLLLKLEESMEVLISEVIFLEYHNTTMVLEANTTVLVLRIEILFNKIMLLFNTFKGLNKTRASTSKNFKDKELESVHLSKKI